MTTRLVDLTQPYEESMPIFPGLPGLERSTLLSREDARSRYADGVEFLIERYSLTGNSGTYMDAPFHLYPDGLDLATLPLDSTVGLPGIRVDARDAMSSGRRRIDESFLNGVDVQGHAVLFWTGWDKRWRGEDYLDPNPFVCGDLAAYLAERGARLVGIDTWNIDDTEDMTRPAHSVLLRRGIPIVENLCRLEDLTSNGFVFSAAPLPIRQGTAVPVRAYAVVDGR